MLGILYIIAAVFVGDILCRRFFVSTSSQHRWSAAFLTGILFSTCVNYLTVLAFSKTSSPFLWGNITFVVIAVGMAVLLWKKFPVNGSGIDPEYVRPKGRDIYDHAILLLALFGGSWLFFSTLNYSDGAFHFASRSWSDFGANISLAQSIVLGNNVPPEHPFFPGVISKYHFLFWFLSANLSYLGMNIVWAVNILSIMSLMAMLILLMTFAEVLFNSRAAARITVPLFFLATSSLSYIPFLWSQNGIAETWHTIVNATQYINSGFTYRGDNWGALSVIVYANQRQLISATGIVLIVLIYMVRFFQRKGVMTRPEYADVKRSGKDDLNIENDAAVGQSGHRIPKDYLAFIFCGVLIGALPYWNTPLFLAASLIIGAIFILFPYRHYTTLMIIFIILVGLPQMLLLISGPSPAKSFSYFKWGYIIEDPTPGKVLDYLLWTFGVKLFLLGLAYWLLPKMHRRLFLALSLPAVIVFLFQLSTDMFNNHKLLNIWLALISVYVAFALWTIGRHGIANKVIAVCLAVFMSFGAVLDMFPIQNDGKIVTKFEGDELTQWILENTKPDEIFLSDKFLTHPILMSGRKIYLGNTLYAWTAGYAVGERENRHKMMFVTRSVRESRRMLAQYNISYVAIDDGVRTNDFTKGLDESFFERNYELVYNDTGNKYRNLKIYRIRPAQAE